ncbi:MAG: ATP-binding protein [Pseudomonadota bacterium]
MSKTTGTGAALQRLTARADKWLAATALSPLVLLLPRAASAQSDTTTPGLSSEASSTVGAENPLSTIISSLNLEATNIVTTSVFLGATMFALFAALVVVRERGRAVREAELLKDQLADLRAANEQASALIDLEDQRLVLWRDDAAAPVIMGDLPAATGLPLDRSKFLGFGLWLMPESASSIDFAIDRLRQKAEGFDLSLRTVTGAFLEARGRTSGGSAFVRFTDLTGDRAMLASLEADHRQLSATLETVQTLIQQIDMPAWVRSKDGHLSWANDAYLQAVDAQSVDDVTTRQIELLATEDRSKASQQVNENGVYRERLTSIMGGQRRRVDVTEAMAQDGFAGLAVDVTEAEEARAQMERQRSAHDQTLDQISSAVAHFDVARTLTTYNEAFASMWGLPHDMLDSQPTHDGIMERMRNDKTLFEPRDWPQWKEEFLAVYDGTEPFETLMHLPDGRTVHAIATPQRGGNVTWVFENLTDKLALEGQLSTLTRVQGETLEHLAEGVAVFGGDGRLVLSNTAFGSMWGLEDENRAAGTHISQLAEHVADGGVDNQSWLALASEITALRDRREGSQRQIVLERTAEDGSALAQQIYHCVVVPLPDAQTMLTFVNVTDSVNVAHALTERNEALEAAEVLKNAFVANMSYELRTLLTSIRGFTEVLLSQALGPLNERQLEYMSDVHMSSGKLELIVDSMLDLASIDAGLLELDVQCMPLAPVCGALSQRFASQLAESDLNLICTIGDVDVVADPQRLQQVLDQVVSNAIRYSPKGGEIRLTASQTPDHTIVVIEDDGPGIPDDFAMQAFSRFEGRNTETARKGAGLGLALVNGLMELHGGDVQLTSSSAGAENGRGGTRIACSFPHQPPSAVGTTAPLQLAAS